MYDNAITRTATTHAPRWHIVPADKKWFRYLAVAQAIGEALGAYRHEWKEALTTLAKAKLAELAALRAAHGRGEKGGAIDQATVTID